MPSWKDNLVPASFRGVSFFYVDTEREGGRRNAAHEFPLREQGYVEDLGRRQTIYRLTGYVLGDDYFTDRDALEAALQTPGAGTLIHPYKGPLQVNVQRYRLRETKDDGRLASFEMEFIEAGSQPSPTSASDTSSAAQNAGSASNSQLASSFQKFLMLPGRIFDTAQNLISNFENAVTGLVGVSPADLSGFVSNLQDLIATPSALASQITGFFGAYVDVIVNTVGTFDDTLSSRGPSPVADPSYGLADLASWGSDLPPVPIGTPQQQQIATNQAAMIALVRGSAVSSLVALYAQTQFASVADAETAREQVTGLIDGMIDEADADGDDDAFKSYMTLYQAVATDLTLRGKQLPDVVDYDLNANLPALTLAERFYADASRDGELVARNAARHPLFMPLTVEALSS